CNDTATTEIYTLSLHDALPISYTLKVMAVGYHSKEVEVSIDGGVNLDISLEPMYTYPGGEIGYDDGTAENARAFYDAGNGWAVKDRKSTRLNSSHVSISYAVFC